MITPVHIALAKLFGLDGQKAFGFELRCFAGETVKMVVHQHILDENRLQVDDTHRFILTLDDPVADETNAELRRIFSGCEKGEPFDLDRACELAMQRVRDGIEESARKAMEQLSWPSPGLNVDQIAWAKLCEARWA